MRWTKEKNPTWFTPRDEVFSFCGIWDRWKSSAGEEINSSSIITTDANELGNEGPQPHALRDYRQHDCPLDRADNARRGASIFLGQFPASQMKAQAVSQFVNKVGNKGPKCIAPLNSA